ncbi:ketohexokinase isoform X1 [Nilaparvata lugens]|uniref:ketohexokinase isoform X1 n=2 Tax=Nilaparvata lugens TaxID=108931 RepID=UPI00193E365E|nr:ketohexokinase isoform X1 [Nilaparvata lugens]
MKPRKILCVGLVCVDIVQVCECFPDEDSDRRSVEHCMQRGGNASNMCTVLSQLGADCEFLGSMSNDLFSEFAMKDFSENNISTENCICHIGQDLPLSTVIINKQNGSRTIIHSNKSFPELKIHEFEKIDFSAYSWVHFEGRNIKQTTEMMKFLLEWREKSTIMLKISVEIEKPRSEQEILITLADVVLLGKDFAIFSGCNSMSETIHKFKHKTRNGATLISVWGTEGATGYTDNIGLKHSPAFLQQKTVDTLGAGDTFAAALIHSLNEGHELDKSVEFACKVAGAKTGIKGFSQLKTVCQGILN